jgi:hypothetical protein
MESLLKKKRVWCVEPLADTLDEQQACLERQMERYRHRFVSDEECRLFAMLPLDENQRERLLQALGEEANFRAEIENCRGDPGSPGTHRSYCLSCCELYKPDIAAPYY